MDFNNDLDILFADSDVTIAVGVGAPFPAIFSQPGEEVQMFDGSVMSSVPAATVKSSDVAANSITNGSTVAVTSVSMGLTSAPYTVAKVTPDSLGLSIIAFIEG